MIAGADIAAWRDAGYAWRTNAMVEQDLIISRIMVEIFSDPFLRDAMIFRGGTALNKLCFPRPLRYSEDVDLVQREAGPIGPIFDAVRRALVSYLKIQDSHCVFENSFRFSVVCSPWRTRMSFRPG